MHILLGAETSSSNRAIFPVFSPFRVSPLTLCTEIAVNIEPNTDWKQGIVTVQNPFLIHKMIDNDYNINQLIFVGDTRIYCPYWSHIDPYYYYDNYYLFDYSDHVLPLSLLFQIARALVIFNIDEIIIFDESGAAARWVRKWKECLIFIGPFICHHS